MSSVNIDTGLTEFFDSGSGIVLFGQLKAASVCKHIYDHTYI